MGILHGNHVGFSAPPLIQGLPFMEIGDWKSHSALVRDSHRWQFSLPYKASWGWVYVFQSFQPNLCHACKRNDYSSYFMALLGCYREPKRRPSFADIMAALKPLQKPITSSQVPKPRLLIGSSSTSGPSQCTQDPIRQLPSATQTAEGTDESCR